MNITKKQNVVHIASFQGNLGDLINHKGFYSVFNDLIDVNVVNKIEIRDFYQSSLNMRTFNDDLLNEINKSDLLILGGGAYFDVRWDYSSTGTTLNFSREFIENVKVPVLVNAIGYHEFPGKTTESEIDKFKLFLEDVIRRDNWLITVRNDGSFERILHRYGKEISDHIVKTPDNGFYYSPVIKEISKNSNTINGRYVGLCITNDLFSQEFNKSVTEEYFNLTISELINRLIESGYSIIMFPHVRDDLSIIESIILKLPRIYQQTRIIVAPLDTISENAPYIMSLFYSQCDVIIGMRFHSLVLSLDNHIPAIALAGHEQIETLYSELGLNDYCIRVDNYGFSEKIIEAIDHKNEMKKVQSMILDNIMLQADNYHSLVQMFIDSGRKF